MTQPQFTSNPGKITDFSGIGVADIFNESIMPRVNSLASVLEQSIVDLDQATAERRQRFDETSNLYDNTVDQQILGTMDMSNPVQAPQENYDSPVMQSSSRTQATPQRTTRSATTTSEIRLSNYGYNSDSSPDHNSNILKIGHANNPLKDGVSAALTKSLATRHGLKTGDMFEITTADGATMRRRYDDTVPTTYKGNPLPETVDLYELNGSNKFGGKIIKIRPL